MLRAALRRITLLLAGVLVGVSALSLLLGVLFGASVARSVSLGLTVVGSFLLISGFFVGNRGPVRVKDEDTPSIGPLVFGNRLLRWATPSEREETINLSAVFVTVGFTLILIGLAADPRYTLF
jgi:hypothetical protein